MGKRQPIKKSCQKKNCTDPNCPFPHVRPAVTCPAPTVRVGAGGISFDPKCVQLPVQRPRTASASTPAIVQKRLCDGSLERKCRHCHQSFKLDEKQQSWFKERGFSLPRRCQECRTFLRKSSQQEGRDGCMEL